MTSWQDQYNADPFAAPGGAGAGRQLSRREAREAERRAAETLVEKPPHPSGVVDFEAHDFGADFVPDQEINVGDTQDIWQALTRGAQPAPASRFTAGVPEAPAPRGEQDAAAMPNDLMDRVRDAVLRRPAEPAPQRAPSMPPTAFPTQGHDRAAPESRPTTAPGAVRPAAGRFDSQPYDVRALTPEATPTRRERRMRETADLREDGLPVELFAPRAPSSAPVPQQQPAYDEYAEVEADGYYDYDAPYAPEPTIAIPVRAAGVEQPLPGADPVALPQAFAEPAGDDVITFSNPIAQVRAEPHDHYLQAEADPEFIEPADEDDDDWEAQAVPTPAPRSASVPIAFLPPQDSVVQPQPWDSAPQPQQRDARFQDLQVGPPSEMTDLAGFEALIRKARNQPLAPQPADAPAARPAAAWADDDEDDRGGFGTLLNRQVQSSHGTSPALILPNDPQLLDVTQAVSGTGDIFVTGTMKLSRSLSTTGGHDDLYDSHEIDRLYDVAHDEPAAGVAPVRASKAVSGSAANRTVVTGRPGRGNVLPTVLAVVAGAMAVGVVALLVGSWVLHIF